MKWSLLKDKNFALLKAGRAVSKIGSNMQQFVLALYVLSITGSATLFASMLAIAVLPGLLLAPVAGVFGDWFDRKKTIVRTDILNGIIIGIFAVIFMVNGELTIPMIYLLIILLEITETFFSSAMAGVVPSIVKKEDLPHANSIGSLISSAAGFLSPVIAGALYGLLGLQIILIVNAISFIISGISEMFIDIPPNHKSPEKVDLANFKKDLFEGIKVIKENKAISTIVSLAAIINFCLTPLFGIGTVYVAKEVLAVSDMVLAYSNSVLTLSVIAAPFIFKIICDRFKSGELLYLSTFSLGFIVIVMGLCVVPGFVSIVDNNVVIMAMMTAVGVVLSIVATVMNIGLATVFQKVVPIEYMGRAGTVFNLVATVAAPLGFMIFGFLFDTILSFVVFGMAGTVVVVAVLSYKRRLLEADNEQEETTTKLESVEA